VVEIPQRDTNPRSGWRFQWGVDGTNARDVDVVEDRHPLRWFPVRLRLCREYLSTGSRTHPWLYALTRSAGLISWATPFRAAISAPALLRSIRD